METIKACSLGVKSLYRYQPFNNEDHTRWLEQILRERKIFLSSPASFNDPWDCRVWYDSEGLDDPDTLERYIQETDRCARAVGLQTTEEEHQRRLNHLRQNPEFYRKEVIDPTSVEMQDEIDKQYRVYCLSTESDHTLMWSHYADGHKGICLEFDCDNDVFSGAFKVIYREEYPVLDFTDNGWRRNLGVLLTKSSAWEYEREYRLVAMEGDYADDVVLQTKNHLLEIPKDSLKSVIIGCRMEEKFQRAVEGIIGQYGKGGIAVKKMHHVPNRYELNME